ELDPLTLGVCRARRSAVNDHDAPVVVDVEATTGQQRGLDPQSLGRARRAARWTRALQSYARPTDPLHGFDPRRGTAVVARVRARRAAGPARRTQPLEQHSRHRAV